MIQPQLLDQLRHNNALLLLGPGVLASDRLRAACATLARLPFRRVIMLGQAGWLADAWQRAGRKVQMLSENEPLARLDESRVTWLELPAEQDLEEGRWAGLLRVWFARHSACLLGCDLEHPLVRGSIQESGQATGADRPPHFAILEQAAEGDRRYWIEHNLSIQVEDPCGWIQELLSAWEKDGSRDDREAPAAAPGDGRPYQFLDFYTEADARRFFGREAAIRELGEMALAYPLVICFGPSGVGKSSLLQAGLMPRLRRQGCLPLYSRPQADPVQSIRQAALAAWPGLLAPLAEAGTMPASGVVPLPNVLASLAEQTQQTVVILFDQFEEVFTLLGDAAVRQLAEVLSACLSPQDRPRQGPPVRFVLSLREDFLTRLHAMRSSLPGVFAHRYRLHPLEYAEARQAILAPAEQAGLAYEAGLVEQLLLDLGGQAGTVDPPNLQVVCEALYRDLVECGGRTFRLERYRELGGAKDLLGSYLEGVVAEWADPEACRAVLKAMVTTLGTKISLPAAEIAHLAGLEANLTQSILEKLERPHRLVRTLEGEGERRFELAHEVLGLRILAWIQDPAEREARAVHDLLRAELRSWQTAVEQVEQIHAQPARMLPGPGKLQIVYTQRDNPYLRFSPQELELLVSAALEHGSEPAYWLERAAAAGLPPGNYLLPALASPQAEVRRRAAALLGAAVTAGELERLLQDSDPGRRARATETLGEVCHPRAWRALKRARHDPQADVRRLAWDGLEKQDARAAGRLRRQDETIPLLAAGSLVYWLLLFSQAGPSLAPGVWATGGLAWLAGVLVLLQVAPRLPRAGLAWASGLASAWLLVKQWGWLRGGGVFGFMLLLGGELRSKPHLALAACLPYLPLLLGVPASADNFLWATAGVILALSALALGVPLWGNYGKDRPAAITLLSADLAGLAAAWAAGAASGEAAGALLLGVVLAAGRAWARGPQVYSGGSQQLVALLADLGKVLWDVLDYFSFNLKPWLAGLGWAAWVGVLLQAAAGLSPGSVPAWTIGGALWLVAGVGLGLWWAPGSLLWSLFLPALGGALGGWLAHGQTGAIIGAGIGLGLGFGEWLAKKISDHAAEK